MMKAITELSLRQSFKKGIPDSIELEKGQILTPSAAQFLNEKKVKLVQAGTPPPEASGKQIEAKVVTSKKNPPGYERQTQYISAGDGGIFTAKPEHMTQLKGKLLVPKSHPRIVFRGKIDTLQAEILLLQHKSRKNQVLAGDLEEILIWTRNILKAEVLEQELEQEPILGLNGEELRAQSHNPKKHFNIGHILPTADMSGTTLELNRIRALVREAELVAVTAFAGEYRIERKDIIQALNRMSSAVYVMMLRTQAGIYRLSGVENE